MPSSTPTMAAGQYNSRWFIWTIVFLVVTGISLVSYIVLSDNTSSDVQGFSVGHRVTVKAK